MAGNKEIIARAAAERQRAVKTKTPVQTKWIVVSRRGK